MQRYGLGIMVVWWACLGMALAVEQSQLSPTEMVHVGHRYFVRYCSACHGAEGRGDGRCLSPPVSPADLTRIAQRRGGISPSPRSSLISTVGAGCWRMAVGTCQSGASVSGRSWGMTCSARLSSAAISRSSSPTCKPSSNKGHAMPWEPIHKSSQNWALPPTSWITIRRAPRSRGRPCDGDLDGLPGGRGLNIAHEAVDRHANGARRDHPLRGWARPTAVRFHLRRPPGTE